ncbi:hypothetical protein GGR52DRAFT_533870 [Hypoxylon sp. FL1284]|nr:hypothetical protein GGR52DRAFT_533870 [Hypoxylon sp. FL1284]
MATSREERMQQRMRGAGRHEVADDSFGFVLPGAEPSPDPTPVQSIARSEPNTSAKRRRLDPEPDTTNVQPPSSVSDSSRRTSARLSGAKADPYQAIHDDEPVNEPEPQATPSPPLQDLQGEDEAPESLPAVIQRPSSRGSVVSRLSAEPALEEVTESPADAPGSGRRRSIRVPESLTRSAKLLRDVTDEDAGATGEVTLSSPLARKSRVSGASSIRSARSTRASARASLESTSRDIDELTPTAGPSRFSNGTVSTGSARSRRSQNKPATPSTVDALSSPPEAAGTSSARKPKLRPKSKAGVRPPQAKSQLNEVEEDARDEIEAGEEEVEEAQEADEIDVQTAARRIGQKRPRISSPREESPELGSRTIHTARPAKRSKKKQVQTSPAKQSQPKAPKTKCKESATRRRSDGEAIPITVQRYTNRTHPNEDDGDADILHDEIPFANRGGVNVVDVLSQICDEVIDSSLETLHEAAVNAKDSATKKELRTKLRALQAFQEELRTRLLEHTIALDTMHALKKRVRSVQKEKLALRAEIMGIRAEREQVALKMDAVRVRHENANRESLHQLGLSSTMDDIELAMENGRSAPSLSAKEQKTAELANLELLISRVAGQASTAGDGGGNLKQVKDFNAFLERAAAALERR